MLQGIRQWLINHSFILTYLCVIGEVSGLSPHTGVTTLVKGSALAYEKVQKMSLDHFTCLLHQFMDLQTKVNKLIRDQVG